MTASNDSPAAVAAAAAVAEAVAALDPQQVQELLLKKKEDLTPEEQDLRKELKAQEKLKKKLEKKEAEKARKKEKKAQQKDQPAAEKADQQEKQGGGKVIKKNTNLLGIESTKEEDFGEWFQQVIVKSEMIEYYDISGCYILRPWSYQIWEKIQSHVDTNIKKLGVQNSYFPLFVTKARLETEKDHIEGFAPEVAWVTRSGNSEMAEPIAVRPTSETIMYPAFAQWIRSHRDLPLRLNQWSNVVRWEFKHPVPFIRSREFLWQEGHTAFATKEEAVEEVYQILDIYRSVYEDLLAVPVVKGRKTDVEKFAGGDFTTTVEAYIDGNGRAVQGGTSHCLGQNFSKMFKIQFETEDDAQEKSYVWQNSWGLTTRTIGVMVMVHSDNKGLVLPPRVAPIQVVIIPLFFKDPEQNKQVAIKADEYARLLKSQHGVTVTVDKSEHRTPGWKYNYWEMKGVPLRVEIGPKDLEKQQAVAVKRYNGAKSTVPEGTFGESVVKLLDDIHNEMLDAARTRRDDHMDTVTEWPAFVPSLEKKNIILAPFCETTQCEENIKKRSGEESKLLAKQQPQETSMTGAAKSLCIPLEQKPLPEGARCFCCGHEAKSWTLFGRSY